jgi:hypothetical protein
MFFWVWAPCGLAGRSQRFGEVCCLCLHLQNLEKCCVRLSYTPPPPPPLTPAWNLPFGLASVSTSLRPDWPFLSDFPSCLPIYPLIPSMVTSALKMETVRFSETLASTSQSTWRPNPEKHYQYFHSKFYMKSNLHLLFHTFQNSHMFSANSESRAKKACSYNLMSFKPIHVSDIKYLNLHPSVSHLTFGKYNKKNNKLFMYVYFILVCFIVFFHW